MRDVSKAQMIDRCEGSTRLTQSDRQTRHLLRIVHFPAVQIPIDHLAGTLVTFIIPPFLVPPLLLRRRVRFRFDRAVTDRVDLRDGADGDRRIEDVVQDRAGGEHAQFGCRSVRECGRGLNGRDDPVEFVAYPDPFVEIGDEIVPFAHPRDVVFCRLATGCAHDERQHPFAQDVFGDENDQASEEAWDACQVHGQVQA